MAGPADILRELHRLRRFAADLKEQIDRGPRLLQVQKARVTKQEETLRQAQETLKRLKVTTHEKEVSLKGVLGQISKYQKQLNEAAGKKEYDALKTEIANANKEVQKLEDEILEGMAETEDRTAQLPELENALKKLKEEVSQYERDYSSRQAGLAAHLFRLLHRDHPAAI
jgi:predicted  nucleic acid-binding Zn-ribbon protein